MLLGTRTEAKPPEGNEQFGLRVYLELTKDRLDMVTYRILAQLQVLSDIGRAPAFEQAPEHSPFFFHQ